MKTHTKETQSTMTPEKSLQFLKEGNERFQNNLKANRNLLQQVNETSDGQFPFAVILSCIDSRVPAELVFDQGIGDIFSVRVAGNIVNEDILGSIEYGCKVAGSKVVVVLGHTACGAVKGACDDVKLGNITPLLAKIKPAVKAVKEPTDIASRIGSNNKFVDEVVYKNVQVSIDQIKANSQVLTEMEAGNEIIIVGAVYDVASGKIDFLD
jgi:carbonic anhydrase